MYAKKIVLDLSTSACEIDEYLEDCAYMKSLNNYQ